jgi:hypothetical protein
MRGLNRDAVEEAPNRRVLGLMPIIAAPTPIISVSTHDEN